MPSMSAPVAPMELELTPRSAGWQSGVEPGAGLGKSTGSAVGATPPTGRVQAFKNKNKMDKSRGLRVMGASLPSNRVFLKSKYYRQGAKPAENAKILLDPWRS